MLTVLIPATETRLTQVDTIKAEIDVTDAGQDLEIGALIDQQSAAIRSFLSRVLARETVRQTERVSGEATLILERRPVAEVVGVTVDGAALDPADFERDGALLRRLCNDRPSLWWGKVAVDYAAGWRMPGETGRDLPEDIERACIDLCVRAYHARGRDPALRSYENPDVEKMSWSASDSVKTVDGLPEDIAGRLGGYRLVTIA